MRIPIILALGILATASRIKVLSPDEVANWFQTQNCTFLSSLDTIQGSDANFGHIPYGKTICGRGTYVKAQDGSGDTDACSPVTTVSYEESHHLQSEIVFADRGNCYFVDKVNNIENARAQAAVIVDNRDQPPELLIMSDAGFGRPPHIPSTLISKQEGSIIKEYLSKQGEAIHLCINFNLGENRTSTVNFKIFFTSGDLKSMLAISELEEFMNVFKQNIKLEVHFIVEKKSYASSAFIDEHCYANGTYCGLVDPGRSNRMSGRQVLDQDLRQSRIYDADPDKWFEYLKLFAECEDNIKEFAETKDCSENAMKQLNLTPNQIQLEASKTWNEDKTENQFLNQEMHEWSTYWEPYIPTMVINYYPYRGEVTSKSIIEAICSDYIQGGQCENYKKPVDIPEKPIIDEVEKSHGGISVPALIAIIVVVLLINVVVLCLYRRYQRKEIDKEMQLQIHSAVSQYISLSDRNH